jgi:hypothetical protein
MQRLRWACSPFSSLVVDGDHGVVRPRDREARMGGGPMTEDAFWKIIALFDWEKTGDDDAVLRPAVEALAAMSEADIFRFDDILSEKLYALDTREHARHVYAGSIDVDDGDAYISPDDFLYSRCVVVANGKQFYDQVLSDPTKSPQEMEFEALLYVAGQAYEAKTGDEYEHVPPLSFESFSNTDAWKPAARTKPGKYTSERIPPGNRRPT